MIYRRIDDEFLDPLQFNPDSVLGVAGMLNAARAGNVVIANAVGNGVGDDKLVYTYVPGDDRLLPRREADAAQRRHVPLLARPDERDHVLAQLDELVLKPVEGSGGYGILFGPNASAPPAADGAPGDPRRPARLDRPAGRPALDGADQGRRQARAPARRPAAVRGQRRRQRLRAARRADPGRAAGGQPGGQLQPGRRAARTPGCSPRAGPPEGERELGEQGLATVAPASSPAAEMGPELSTSAAATAATATTAARGTI